MFCSHYCPLFAVHFFLIFLPRTCPSFASIMPIAYVPVSLKTFDITEPHASPAGATFFPSSPMAESEGRTPIEPWPELDNEWENHLREQPNRFLLTSSKRSDIKHYLRNPDLPCRGTTKKDRKADASFKNWAIETFELQDGQVYLQAKVKKNGETRPAKYAACKWDAMILIQKVHLALHHAGMFPLPLYGYTNSNRSRQNLPPL